ncbi:ribonuclease toxin HepT-like protein [Trichothermofontia sp.]
MTLNIQKMQDLAVDLRAELNRLSQLEAEIDRVRHELTKNADLADIFYENLALKLHNFYTGCERIFQLISSELNGGIPSGFDWHKRLLERMSIDRNDRPAVISAQTAYQLREYLGFRHIVRNIYGFELDPVKIAKLIEHYPIVWQAFEQEVIGFISWLEKLAEMCRNS